VGQPGASQTAAARLTIDCGRIAGRLEPGGVVGRIYNQTNTVWTLGRTRPGRLGINVLARCSTIGERA
jgi:hypothetical protein